MTRDTQTRKHRHRDWHMESSGHRHRHGDLVGEGDSADGGRTKIRQAGRQAGRQADRQAGRQTGRQTDIQTDR